MLEKKERKKKLKKKEISPTYHFANPVLVIQSRAQSPQPSLRQARNGEKKERLVRKKKRNKKIKKKKTPHLPFRESRFGRTVRSRIACPKPT
jgi:hypothetical protein